MKKLRRILDAVAAAVLVTTSLFYLAPVVVRAAVDACTWTGTVNDNFSNAANWSCATDGAAVPGSGDSLIFDNTALSADKVLNKDISGISFNAITFQGSSQRSFTITGSALAVTGSVTNNSSATQYIDTNVNLEGNVTFSTQNFPIVIGTLANGGVLDLGAYTATFDGIQTQIHQSIQGSGNIVKNGTGTLYLDNGPGGTNTFTGTVSINQGTIYASNVAALGTAAGGTTIADGANLHIALSGLNPPQATLSEPFTIAGDGQGVGFTNSALSVSSCQSMGCTDASDLTLSGSITLTADTVLSAVQNGKITITGALSGAFKLSMAGGALGKIILNASPNNSLTPNGILTAQAETNTYSDSQPGVPITVGYNQTAIVTGTRGDISVEDGGVLKGSGTVGAVQISSGGTLAPGLSPGCLNTGNVTFLNGSTYEFEVGGAVECTEYDQTKVTGTVDLGSSTLGILLFNGFKPAQNQSYKIIDNDGNDAVTGTFTGLAEGATLTVDGNVFRVSYVGGDGNDVVLTVVSIGTPNTGFARLRLNNPLVMIAITLGSTIALGFAARKMYT